MKIGFRFFYSQLRVFRNIEEISEFTKEFQEYNGLSGVAFF
jgi:hypothetical protein